MSEPSLLRWKSTAVGGIQSGFLTCGALTTRSKVGGRFGSPQKQKINCVLIAWARMIFAAATSQATPGSCMAGAMMLAALAGYTPTPFIYLNDSPRNEALTTAPINGRGQVEY